VQEPGGSDLPSLEYVLELLVHLKVHCRSLSYRIILVHGFKSSRTSGIREDLEQQLKYETREHFRTTARASAFAFDATDILLKGVDELEIASDKLIGKIRSLGVRLPMNLADAGPR
jgi:hypothetical protein